MKSKYDGECNELKERQPGNKKIVVVDVIALTNGEEK